MKQVQKRNYQKELDRVIEELAGRETKPRLLLHCCCAPCSSYVLEYLSQYFRITVFFYNPNIYPPEEYCKRIAEERRLVEEMGLPGPVDVLEPPYRPDEFYQAVKGLEREPEGGARCMKCFELRLGRAAQAARDKGYDYFTTTLSISPLKSAQQLNRIGEALGEANGIPYLVSDFKKRDGYKRSIQLSGQYGLYRQDYCGCAYSRN